MQIEALEIGNYRLFQQAKLTKFPCLSVVIGPNGSGKSTVDFLSGFPLLCSCQDG